MAKFRNGNLVLTNTQSIILGGVPVIDSSRVARLEALKFDNSLSVIIDEFSTDPLMTENSDTRIPTEKAIKSYVDAQLAGISSNMISQGDSYVRVIDTTSDSYIETVIDGIEVSNLTSDVQTFGVGANAHITVDQTSSSFITDSTSRVEAFSITEYGIKLEDGTRINEFSTDATLVGDSDTAVPTEKAIKTYVDPWLTIKHDEFDNMFSYNSGVALTSTSPDNIVMGVDAGLYQGQGIEKQNIFIGKYAARGVDGNPGTNSGNTCIGYYAGYNLRNGLHNVFLGTQSANYLIGSPSNNIGIGRYACAGQNTTDSATPSDNIGLGDSALLRIDSGDHNIAMGDSAMLTLTDGRHNIAMGNRALYYATTSEFNIALGYNSQRRLTVGYHNISIGYFAGYNALTSERGVNIGYQAGMNETVSDKLHIANNATDSLIEGDFAGRTLIIHGSLTLDNGTDVNEFSIDGTLAGNSDDALPTEQAVKTYVDTQLAGISSNMINAGDSYVKVVDDGTTTGYVEVVVDGVQVQYWDAESTSIRMGKESGAGKVTLTDTTVAIAAGDQLQVDVESYGVRIYNDLTVSGDVFIDGTAFIIHVEEVKTDDNLITLNYGEPGHGVTKGIAGVEIDRGTLENYYFVFAENTDTFRVGDATSTQAVATREDSPTDMRVPWWNDTEKRMDTLGTSAITVNTTTDVITMTAASGVVGTFESDGLTLASGTNINEFSTDGTLVGDSDNTLPTEQAVKTYVDTEIDAQSHTIFQGDSQITVHDDTTAAGYVTIIVDAVEVANFSKDVQVVGGVDSYITIDQTAGATVIGKDSVEAMTIDENGLQLFTSGATINEFSTDGTLADNSDEAVPTEQAVKTYVDGSDSTTLINANAYTDSEINEVTSAYQAGDATTLINANAYTDSQIDSQSHIIFEGDSYVKVVDDGTTTGYVEIVTDGVQVAYFDESSSTQRIGKATSGSTSNIEVADASIVTNAQGNEVMTLSPTSQTIGLAGDSRVEVSQVSDSVDVYAGALRVVEITPDVQTFGAKGDTYLTVDQTSNTIVISEDNVNAATFSEDGLTLISGATVGEFSTDGTLADDSDEAVPTEKAVKTYVDAIDATSSIDANAYADAGDVSTLSSANSYADGVGVAANVYADAGDATSLIEANTYTDTEINDLRNEMVDQIIANDSYVRVVDDGTATSYVEVVVDGEQVQYWDAEATSIRMGKESGAGRIKISDTSIESWIGWDKLLDIEEAQQVLGLFGGTWISLNQSVEQIAMVCDGTSCITLGKNAQTFGNAVDTNMRVDQSANSFIFEAGDSIVSTIDGDGLTLASGTNINEFSIDGTLAGDSDNAVPTEQAVKTYVASLLVVSIVSSDTTANTGDVLLVDSTSGDIAIELATGLDTKITVKKTSNDGNSITITPSSGTIDGEASKVITTQYQDYTFVSDGVNFFII